MTHTTGTRADWLAERVQLLRDEKELTERSDAIAARRQALPWVRIDKDYDFDVGTGTATLKDLFGGRSQLIVYHFMFGPDYSAGCPSCSSIADGFNGVVSHLENHDVAFWAISRAPVETLHAFRDRMGWSFPWASSGGSDFNADFNVWFTAEQQREGEVDYNYRREQKFVWREDKDGGGQSAEQLFAKMSGVDVPTYHRDRPGLSAFAIQDGAVHHTYSSYARGLDSIWGVYHWLDRAPLGRNEAAGAWWKRHDEYGR